MAAPIREIVIGGMTGDIVSAAYAHIVKDIRQRNITDINEHHEDTYQEGVDTVPLLDIYSDDAEVANKAAGYFIYNSFAIFPEMCLKDWSLEKVIITEETKINSQHSAKGLVLLRCTNNRTMRLWVEVKKHFTEDGDIFKIDQHCRSAYKDEKADAILKAACEVA